MLAELLPAFTPLPVPDNQVRSTTHRLVQRQLAGRRITAELRNPLRMASPARGDAQVESQPASLRFARTHRTQTCRRCSRRVCGTAANQRLACAPASGRSSVGTQGCTIGNSMGSRKIVECESCTPATRQATCKCRQTSEAGSSVNS